MTLGKELWESEMLMDHLRELRDEQYLATSNHSPFLQTTDSSPLNWVRDPGYLTEAVKRMEKEVIEEKAKKELKFFDPEELDLDD